MTHTPHNYIRSLTYLLSNQYVCEPLDTSPLDQTMSRRVDLRYGIWHCFHYIFGRNVLITPTLKLHEFHGVEALRHIFTQADRGRAVFARPKERRFRKPGRVFEDYEWLWACGFGRLEVRLDRYLLHRKDQ